MSLALTTGLGSSPPPLTGTIAHDRSEKRDNKSDYKSSKGYTHYKMVKETEFRPIFGIACFFRYKQHARNYTARFDHTHPESNGRLDVFNGDPDAKRIYDPRNWRGLYERTVHLARLRLARKTANGRWLGLPTKWKPSLPWIDYRRVRGELNDEDREELRQSSRRNHRMFSAMVITGNLVRIRGNLEALDRMEQDKDSWQTRFIYGLIGSETITAGAFIVTQGSHSLGSWCVNRVENVPLNDAMPEGHPDLQKHIKWNRLGFHFDKWAKWFSAWAQGFQVLCGVQKLGIEIFYGNENEPDRIPGIVDGAADIAMGVGGFFYNIYVRNAAIREYAKTTSMNGNALLLQIKYAGDMMSTSMKLMPGWILFMHRAPAFFVAGVSLWQIYRTHRTSWNSDQQSGRVKEISLTTFASVASTGLFLWQAWLSRSAAATLGHRLCAWANVIVGGLALNQWSYRNDWEDRPTVAGNIYVREHADSIDRWSKVLEFHH